MGHNHNGTSHCGIYYEREEGDVALLHLSFHNKLLSEKPIPNYRNFVSGHPDREKIAVSDLCRLIYSKHGSAGLRFAVTRSEAFLKDGSLKIDKPGVGFSCATFVKAIFEAEGIPIIRSSTWPEATDEDIQWHSLFADYLAKDPQYENDEATHEHARAMDFTCKWSRFKPEQIAYAASIAPPPASYKKVAVAAAILLRSIIKECVPVTEPDTTEPDKAS